MNASATQVVVIMGANQLMAMDTAHTSVQGLSLSKDLAILDTVGTDKFTAREETLIVLHVKDRDWYKINCLYSLSSF